MEVVAATAAVLSLVKATKVVRTWIGNAAHVAQHVAELHSDLESFEILAQGLRRAVNSGGLTSEALREHAETAIADAAQTIERIKTAVQSARNGPIYDSRRLQFVLRESRCAEMRRQIRRHSNALTGIMLVVIHDSSVQRHSQLVRSHTVLHGRGEATRSRQTSAPPDPNKGKDRTAEVPKNSSTVVNKDSRDITSPWLDVDGAALSRFTSQASEDHSSLEAKSGRRRSSTTAVEDIKNSEPWRAAPQRRRSSATVVEEVESRGPQDSVESKSPSLQDESEPLDYSAPGVINEAPGRPFNKSKHIKTSVRTGLFKRLFSLLREPVVERIVPESSDGIRIATTGSAADLSALFRSGGAFPTDRSADGWTLLMNATYYGSLKVIELLIKSKTTISATDTFGRQASHLAFVRSFNVGATELDRQRLLSFPNWQDCAQDFEFTPIHSAALGDYSPGDKERPSLEAIIEFSHDLNNMPPGQDLRILKLKYRGRSLLYCQTIELFRAAECEQRQQLGSRFQKVYLDLINVPDALQGWTPFHWATYAGREQSMRTLLAHSANPFLTTKMRRNALHQAAESMRQTTIEIIFSLQPDPVWGWLDVNLQDAWGETPLHIAIYRGSPSLVRRLLERGARRDLPTKEGHYVALHYAANLSSNETQTELVQILATDQGPHINVPDENGCPALFSLLKNPTAVRTLLNSGADLSVLDNAGSSLLHHACQLADTETLEMILANPSLPEGLALKPNKLGEIPLACAIRSRSTAAAKLMLERYGPGNLDYKDGRSLVHRAVEAGDAEFVEAAFRHPSFRRGRRTAEGWTTRELASRSGNFSGRIRDLVLRYEGFAVHSRSEAEAAAIRGRARLEYFAVIR